MKNDKEIEILETAIAMVRQGGYNCFSFRNIASTVGIKSSSVHYHFATKEDLVVAITQYYTEKFLDSLGDPEQLLNDGHNPIVTYVGAFKNELLEDKGMCMCGMLGAEASDLPDSVVAEIQTFFNRNMEWLEQAYRLIGTKKADIHKKALQTISTLEGAMLICNAKEDLEVFDLATEHLLT